MVAIFFWPQCVNKWIAKRHSKVVPLRETCGVNIRVFKFIIVFLEQDDLNDIDIANTVGKYSFEKMYRHPNDPEWKPHTRIPKVNMWRHCSRNKMANDI